MRWKGLAVCALGLLGATLAAEVEAEVAPESAANNPYDAQQRALAAETLRARGTAQLLPLLELWANRDEASRAQTEEALERIARHRRLDPSAAGLVEVFRSALDVRSGRLGEASSRLDRAGYLRDWVAVGPFDNEGKRGYGRSFEPEEARAAAFELGETYAGKERDVRWRALPRPPHSARIDLGAALRPSHHVCAFVATDLQSDRAERATLWLGAGGAYRAWWNGQLVAEDEAYRGAFPDRDSARVRVRAGTNRLLVKVCNAEGPLALFARLDADVRAATPAGTYAEGTDTPEPLSSPLQSFEALVARGGAGEAEARFRLARYLALTDGDDPAAPRIRQLAARAAELRPEARYLDLAARSSDERADIGRYVRRYADLNPRGAELAQLWLLQAQVAERGLTPERALAFLDRLEAMDPSDGEAIAIARIEGRMVRAGLLGAMELPRAARRYVREASLAAPGGAGFVRARAEAASAAGARDEAIVLRRAAISLRYDDRASRRVLIADAVRRRERDRAQQHLGHLVAVAPHRARTRFYAASLFEALGDTDAALANLNAVRELAPEDADALVALGELQLRMNQRDAGALSLRAALELRPQDAATRELLEQVEPSERLDESFAADAASLLARRVEESGYSHTTLQDLTVNTVYASGLGSSFRQVAFQLHDDEGARAFRTYSIPFDPGSQRLDIRRARVHRASGEVLEASESFEQQLGEPWYRIYYDTRARVLVFSDLEPGDVLELQWRIDDVAHRNAFADYYGDVTFLQDYVPIRHEEYVLITPEGRSFHFNTPALEGLERTERVNEGQRITRYVAENLQAIRQEPSSPGLTQVAPYLHVSTYADWESVGRWYWGLVQDQLRLDDELRAITRDLVRGLRSERDKVVAIHDWVVQNTRYVGLEFGIHGYKPYRVTQIARRGFGDCKDKASLMFAMFREAGVDAHIVLTRTRRNGRIPDLPASLAVFDHAIAYVPSLDLYIDGTAEHNGIRELPGMDQGVTVLHVWPEGSELRRTPVLPASENRRVRNLEVFLTADGSARIESEDVIAGGGAPSYRQGFQAVGTQRTRLERSLRGIFPALSLSDHRFSDLSDLEAPVRVRYEGSVPQFAERGAAELRVPPTTLSDLTRSMSRLATREHPLDLGAPASYEEVRRIHVPRGMQAAAVPSARVVESPFGRVEMRVESRGRVVEVRTSYALNADLVEAQDYAAFRAWTLDADSLLQQRVVISPLHDR